MKKNQMTVAQFVGKKPTVDFKETFTNCLNFVLKNNATRRDQLAALEEQGHDLTELRASMSRKEYESWLAEQGVLPNLSGSIETTIEKLISLFMSEFAKNRVRVNNQIRFTYSFFQQKYNELHRKTDRNRVCINTIKNHFNKIARAMGSIFQDKYRGQLSLPDRNTNCVVLTFAPNVIQFKNPLHTSVLSCAEPRLPKQNTKPQKFLAGVQETVNTLKTASIFDRKEGTISLADSIADLFR